nr:hypothetical protein [Tanacetum cinerariifolium]
MRVCSWGRGDSEESGRSCRKVGIGELQVWREKGEVNSTLKRGRDREVLMIDCLGIVETDKVIHTMETDIVKLVVKIKSFGISSNEFDKETGHKMGCNQSKRI